MGDWRGEGSATEVVAEVAQSNTAWEAARMDVWMSSATAEQDWALPNSPEGESSPVLQACVPIKAERQNLLLSHFVPLKMPFNPPLPWVTWRHECLWCRAGVSCPLSRTDLCSKPQMPPPSDTWGSIWLTLVLIQLIAAGGRRHNQDLRISVLPWG